jgi:hypothetical protein
MRPADAKDWLRSLNELGQQGWEVVGQIETYPFNQSGGVTQLLLKRRYTKQ